MDDTKSMPRLLQNAAVANSTTTTTKVVIFVPNSNKSSSNASQAAVASQNQSNASSNATSSNQTQVAAAPVSNATSQASTSAPFFNSTFGNGPCLVYTNECNSVNNAINSLNQNANALCNIGDIPETIEAQSNEAIADLNRIYILNQWFYNKPYLLTIGNSNWNLLNVIYPKYQHVLQQAQILVQDRDNQAICISRYAIQDQIDLINDVHDGLANASTVNSTQNECGIDIGYTLSSDAQILQQASNSINTTNQFTAVEADIQQDLQNLNVARAAYEAIWDYINQDFNAGGNTTSGPQLLLSNDNATKNEFAVFYTNVANLVSSSAGTIAAALQAVYQNTFVVPNNLWQNPNFQLPNITLTNNEELKNCSLQGSNTQATAASSVSSSSQSTAGGNASSNGGVSTGSKVTVIVHTP
jgi:hypothetical protein